LYTRVNSLENRGAKVSIPERCDQAAEILAESVTFCDIV
jgi:hypothetical protein